MLALDSVSVSFFAIRNEHANSGAAASWASAPSSISTAPGRRMIKVPTKLTSTAAMRRACRTSPR